jgi:hypothetical protein
MVADLQREGGFKGKWQDIEDQSAVYVEGREKNYFSREIGAIRISVPLSVAVTLQEFMVVKEDQNSPFMECS